MATDAIVPAQDYAVLRDPESALALVRDQLAEQQITEFDLARVRMPSGGGTSWEVPTLDGSEPRKFIEGVCLFSKFSRAYWAGDYAGGSDPPDCSSPNAKLATARDDVDVPATRDESGYLLCDTCALSDWGSSPKGSGRGQACKMARQLFMLVPDRRLPLVLSLPPTSLKPASRFFLDLVDHGVDYRSIVLRVGLEKVAGSGVPDYSRATFAMGGRLSEDQAGFARQYGDSLRPYFERITVATAEEVDA